MNINGNLILFTAPLLLPPSTVDGRGGISAVAFFIGRRVEENVHIPIGLVLEGVGVFPAEEYMSPDGLRPSTTALHRRATRRWKVGHVLTVFAIVDGFQAWLIWPGVSIAAIAIIVVNVPGDNAGMPVFLIDSDGGCRGYDTT
jgi:hypothetical protein